MSLVVGVITLTFGFIGIRLFGQGALTLSATTSVTLWFERRRGIAVGLTSAGGQAMMSLAPLGLAVAIGVLGWRRAWWAAAVVVVAVVVPLAWRGLKDRPADVGQHLDGDPAPPNGQALAVTGWTRGQAVRTGVFWTVTAAVSVAGMIGTGLAFTRSRCWASGG